MTKALPWSFLSIPKSFTHPIPIHSFTLLIADQANPLVFLLCFFLLSFLLYTLPRVHSALVFFTSSHGKDFLLSKPLINEKSNVWEIGVYRTARALNTVYKMKQNKKNKTKRPSCCLRIVKLWNVSQSRYREKTRANFMGTEDPVHAMKACGGNWDAAPLILDLGTGLKCGQVRTLVVLREGKSQLPTQWGALWASELGRNLNSMSCFAWTS